MDGEIERQAQVSGQTFQHARRVTVQMVQVHPADAAEMRGLQ